MSLLTIARERVGMKDTHRVLAYLPVTALVIDVVVIVAVGMTAAAGRAHLGVFDQPADVTGSLDVVGPLMLLGWVCSLGVMGAYRATVFGAGTDEYLRVTNASLLAAGLVGVGSYLAKFDLSRGFYVLIFMVGVPTLIFSRFLFRRALHTARRHGVLLERVIIAGSPTHVDEIARVLGRERWLGYNVIGALTPEYGRREETPSGVPVLGNSDEPIDAIRHLDVNVVFFAGGVLGSADQMRRIVWAMETQHVHVVVAPSVTDVSRERIRVRPVGGLPLMHIDPPTGLQASRWGKRLFDLLGAVSLLIALAPLFALAATRIKLHDDGPVLFRQKRIGRDGREFSCLKFRTMVRDAEARIEQLQVEQGASALYFKMERDPRITRPGQWLRRFSIDELPQLINVLRGDMSLVGPRPQVPKEVALYENHTSRRLRVRPGMTGLWQVSGRNNLSTAEAVRLDLYYVDNWSMLQDLVILWRTIGAVMSSRGAF